MTEAVHINEVIAIDALRVLVDGNDAEGWMAQGLEIDYFICAKTEESVKKNFVEGLVKTIGLYLEEEGNIDNLLEPAPGEVWAEYFQAVSKEQKAVSVRVDFVTDYPFFSEVAFLSSRNESHKESCSISDSKNLCKTLRNRN